MTFNFDQCGTGLATSSRPIQCWGLANRIGPPRTGHSFTLPSVLCSTLLWSLPLAAVLRFWGQGVQF